ncbi:MAG: hypothetical protein JNK63_10555 [Chthonomonas sp.]|nr:hypothetical protein [Chthonomonas sp.]
MKTNQNDLIIRIVAVVLALIACGVIAYNQPQPYVPPTPEAVPQVNLQLPAGTVVKTKGLPNAGESSGGSAPIGAPNASGFGGGGGAPVGGAGGGGGGGEQRMQRVQMPQ